MITRPSHQKNTPTYRSIVWAYKGRNSNSNSLVITFIKITHIQISLKKSISLFCKYEFRMDLVEKIDEFCGCIKKVHKSGFCICLETEIDNVDVNSTALAL